MTTQDATLLGVIVFGLLHGISPSHGWTVAVLYSIRNKRSPLLGSIVSSGIIAGAHFLSSIIVIIAYILVSTFIIQIPQVYLNYAVAIALGILACIFWKEKNEDLIRTQHEHLHNDYTEQIEHEHAHWHADTDYHTHLHLHQKRVLPTLTAIAGFALVLGFAHEEEFVILTLAVGGTNPLLLIVIYATAVSISLIGITILAVKVYTHIEYKMVQYRKYLPKASALILAVMAVGFAIGLL
jgi:ABC-type nickel/cobalt efflux system permease component RcnA